MRRFRPVTGLFLLLGPSQPALRVMPDLGLSRSCSNSGRASMPSGGSFPSIP